MKKCIIETCENPVASGWAKWYCNQHYAELKGYRAIRSGFEQLLNAVLGEDICSVEGCNSKVEVDGLCTKHYNASIKKNYNKVCKVEGCNLPTTTKGFCTKHYGKERLKNPEKKQKRKDSLRKYLSSEKGKEAYTANNQRRRAGKLTPIVEKFTNKEIFERDKWVCQLCGEKVDKRRKHPDTMSASLDHILPLSRGGTHTKDNVQLAHFGCNCSKKNKTPEEFAAFQKTHP